MYVGGSSTFVAWFLENCKNQDILINQFSINMSRCAGAEASLTEKGLLTWVLAPTLTAELRSFKRVIQSGWGPTLLISGWVNMENILHLPNTRDDTLENMIPGRSFSARDASWCSSHEERPWVSCFPLGPLIPLTVLQGLLIAFAAKKIEMEKG